MNFNVILSNLATGFVTALVEFYASSIIVAMTVPPPHPHPHHHQLPAERRRRHHRRPTSITH